MSLIHLAMSESHELKNWEIKISEEVKLEKQDNSQVMKVSEILNYRITISLHI